MKPRFGTLVNQWRQKGWDKTTVVAALLFVTAEYLDFCLKPNLPALKIEFKPN